MSFSSARSFLIRPCVILSLVLFAGIFGAAGCASGEFNYVKTISGGQRVTFKLAAGRVENTQEDGFETLPTQIIPDLSKKVVRLVVGFKTAAAAPRSIRVEDVSDEKPLLIVEDLKPQLKKIGWAGATEWMPLSDPRLQWTTYLDDSFRVYRFTIVRADGSTLVLHQGTMFSGMQKALLRRMFGEKN